jgi:hypothetical protein
MKRNFILNKVIISSLIIVLLACISACTKDEDYHFTTPLMSDAGNHSTFLFRYSGSNASYFANEINDNLGQELYTGNSIGNWDFAATVSVGVSQFLALHSKNTGGDTKEFKIMKLLPTGVPGDVTCSQTWHNSYNTFIAFNVGDRGYVFGEDSDPYGRNWFTQEIYSDGSFAASEAAKGDWDYFYEVATPVYVNGETYIFFQTSSHDHYWFITHVSADGQFNDVCDGYWGHLWTMSSSVTVDGNTYLVGGHNDHDNYAGTEYFIQKINSDGTMGEETDRGGWSNYYYNFTCFTNNGKSYLFACSCPGTAGGPYFIQEITADGKLGSETSHGSLSKGVQNAFALPYYDKPGSFRYSIGWDLSKSSGKPSWWSPSFQDPWNGGTKMGGGAALGYIDGGTSYDAVLMGIQDLPGPDRYYYKVAWNLDGTGKAASWSQTMFGPTIGESQAGAGAEIYDIDGNGVPDMLFMCVDDPEGANSFWYHIGWNLNSQGVPTVWGNKILGPTIGDLDAGGGAAIGDLDGNGKPELVLMGIDDPSDNNEFWIVIGKNMDKFGVPESWTSPVKYDESIGSLSAGGGAALADVNGNGKLDLILLDVDSPQGPNELRCYTGWDLDINGQVAGWSGKFVGSSMGNVTSGGGTAVADIDKNGTLDVLMMIVDNPFGND